MHPNLSSKLNWLKLLTINRKIADNGKDNIKNTLGPTENEYKEKFKCFKNISMYPTNIIFCYEGNVLCYN